MDQEDPTARKERVLDQMAVAKGGEASQATELSKDEPTNELHRTTLTGDILTLRPDDSRNRARAPLEQWTGGNKIEVGTCVHLHQTRI